MRKKWRRVAGLVMTEGVLLAGLVLLLTINRTEWIIRTDILTADRLIRFSWIAWAAVSVIANAVLLLAHFQRIRRAKAAAIKLTFSPDKVQDPAAIRGELTRFMTARPQLRELLQQGLDQLDSIARTKEKMREILERNQLSQLDQAAQALDSAEQTLCRKLVLMLNRALLCDPEEENARRREQVFQQHVQYMRTFLGENENVLNRCEKLLSETVRYVEEKKAGRDTMDLQIMTGVIHSLYDEGIHMEIRQGGTGE